jgi:hypothetical protein
MNTMSSLATPQLQFSMNGQQTSVSPMFMAAIVLCFLSCLSCTYLFLSNGLSAAEIIEDIKPNSSMDGTQTASWVSSSSSCVMGTIAFCYIMMLYASSGSKSS